MYIYVTKAEREPCDNLSNIFIGPPLVYTAAERELYETMLGGKTFEIKRHTSNGFYVSMWK